MICQVKNLLRHPFLHWITSRFFHLWLRSLIIWSQPNLSSQIHHSSYLGTFKFQSSWTYCAVRYTSLFSLISSVHALPLSEMIFLHWSHFGISDVKLCQMASSDSLPFPVNPDSNPSSPLPHPHPRWDLELCLQISPGTSLCLILELSVYLFNFHSVS